MNLSEDETIRIDILRYYVKGQVRNPNHDRYVIRQLKDLCYLRSGITPEIQETLRTTDLGLIYLRSYGVHIWGAPRVVDGTRLKPTILGRILARFE